MSKKSFLVFIGIFSILLISTLVAMANSNRTQAEAPLVFWILEDTTAKDPNTGQIYTIPKDTQIFGSRSATDPFLSNSTTYIEEYPSSKIFQNGFE